MAAATWCMVAAALALGACSSNASSHSGETSSSPSSPVTTLVGAPPSLPRVDLIKEAVTALETHLGAAQQYFEINATSKLVNLFVALNDGKLVQPWVYLDGQLSSTDPHAATGFSFGGGALDFDPGKVLSGLRAALPQDSPDVFFIEAGKGGVVRYSVAVTSRRGGQLVAVVGPDGAVQSVEPQ